MKEFININGTRVRLSIIKKYRQVDEIVLSIYYSASIKTRVDNEIFKFTNEEDLKIVLLELDQYFL